MHRIDTPSRQKDKFGAGKDGFTGGDPQTGTQATQVSADILDALQEEICAVIEDSDSGASLDKSKNNQLVTAIKSIIRSVGMLATETARGVMKVATQEQAEAGTADDVAITPKKLAFGFTARFEDNGYIRFPKWLGSFVIQWGVVASNAAGDCIITFPDAHKSGCFCVIPISGSNMNAAYAYSNKTLTQANIPMFNTGTGAKSGPGHSMQYVTFGR